MKRRMEQLLNGKYEYEMPEIMFSQDKIRVLTKQGENCRGELYLGTQEDKKLRGYVTSSHRRLIPGITKFKGTTVQIPYGVDVAGMEQGQTCNGILTLTTNVGEYQIPFFIEIEKKQVKTSVGEIATMESFTRLAKSDSREAFRLFTSRREFEEILKKEPEHIRAMYEGMSRNPVTYQHMEEFLIGAGAKEPVRISLEEEGEAFFEVKETTQQEFLVHKSGWGHLRIEVEAEGDFLKVSKKVVTNEDFIGSIFRMEYVIFQDRLGHGRHYGKIRLKTPYETVCYEVMATRNQNILVNMGTYEKKRRAALMQGYLKMRLGELDFDAWAAQGHELIQKMREAGCDYPIYQLYEAFIYQQQGQEEKAKEILLKYQDKTFSKKDLELAGTYLYLCRKTGLLGESSNIERKIRSFYGQKEDSFLLLWLLMQVDDELILSRSKTMFMLEEQFDLGGRSPLMYLEAFRLIEKDMTLLYRVNPFLTQVLLFSARHGLLTEELCMRIAYLSSYEKSFCQSLYRLMCAAYEKAPAQDTLDAVCKYIMKGNPRKKEYFPWYEKAVEQGLRLTRLYEYYIETIDEQYQNILPRTLRMYFTYNNTLSDRKKAFVYANVIRHKEEDPETYASYRQSMEQFAFLKLEQGKMNEDYAVIYQEFMEQFQEKEQAAALAEILFTHRLYCDDRKIRGVVVCHGQLKKEEFYPCREGVAYPKIFTKEAVILFEDDMQRRYATTVDYNIRKLFDAQEIMGKCLELEVDNPGLLLHVCKDSQISGAVSLKNMGVYQKLVENEAFTEAFKLSVRRQLLEYYKKNATEDELDCYLKQIDYFEYALVDKKLLVELMVARGMFREAFAVLCEYGAEEVELCCLLKLCSRMILGSGEEEEPDELLSLAYQVYHEGKYDEVILHYLMGHYMGPVREMLDIWERCVGFQLDTYEIEEKLLLLLTFLNEYDPRGAKVLERYVKQRGKEKVILAFLTFWSYGSFVKGEPMPDFVYQCLESAYQREWDMGLVCHLALFSQHGAQKEWSLRQEEQVKSLLSECAAKGLSFAFFSKLPARLLSPYQLDDKLYVEHRANPKSRVMLYYALDTGLGNQLKYLSEPLRNIYEGVYGKAFTLFYGETLHYYFVEEFNGKQKKSNEKVLSMNRVEVSLENKYQLLNQMLADRKLGKLGEVEDKLRSYLRQEKFVKKMYTIEKE